MVGWPQGFTVRGRCSADGEPFHSNNEVSDADVRISDDGTRYEMLAVSNRPVPGASAAVNGQPAQCFYTEAPIGGGAFPSVSTWSPVLDNANEPTMQLKVIIGSDTADAVDTPRVFKHPLSGLRIAYYQARPGDRPLDKRTPGETNAGDVSIIKAATSTGTVGATCTWCHHPPRTVLRAAAGVAWQAPFSSLVGSLRTHHGGVLEPSPVWISSLSKVRLFHGGLTEQTPGGAWIMRIGYADSTDGLSGFVTNPTAVWSPPVEGWPLEGFMPDVFADPTDGTLHLTIVGQGGHLWHYRSADLGATWTSNPNNPILRNDATGFAAAAEKKLGGPCLRVNPAGTRWLLWCDFRSPQIGGVNGGIYLATAVRE